MKSKLQQAFYLVAEPVIVIVAASPSPVCAGENAAHAVSTPVTCVSQHAAFKSESVSCDTISVNPFQNSIGRHLGSITEIDALYSTTDEEGVVHIYSVAEEFTDAIYNKLFTKESLIKKSHPGTSFEFHLRVKQGRHLDSVRPFASELLYLR